MVDLRLELNKVNKKLRHETGKAIADFNMIQDGDRIMVCISGGKDSLTMLDILLSLRDHRNSPAFLRKFCRDISNSLGLITGYWKKIPIRW